jgi:hypothetical protein
MRASARLAALALAGLLTIAAPAWAHDVALRADLSAGQEVPQPGPAGGSGSVDVVVNGDTGQVCYRNLTYQGIGDVTMGHIHRGPAGVAGPVVVNLALMPGVMEGCVQGDAAVVQEMEGDPGAFYVNLHTADFPAGAVRGQLRAS